MILRCSHCQQLLRVDENSLPVGDSVKVRCPHCKVIGQTTGGPFTPGDGTAGPADKPTSDTDYPMLHSSQEPPPTAAPSAVPPVPPSPTPPVPPNPDRSAAASTAAAAGWSDTSLPSDAFHSFRFPAERDKRQAEKQTRMGSTWKFALWALASLAVIGFFALLVNIVLPGPGGVRPAIHTVPPHDRASEKVLKQSVGTNQEMDDEADSRRR